MRATQTSFLLLCLFLFLCFIGLGSSFSPVICGEPVQAFLSPQHPCCMLPRGDPALLPSDTTAEDKHMINNRLASGCVCVVKYDLVPLWAVCKLGKRRISTLCHQKKQSHKHAHVRTITDKVGADKSQMALATLICIKSHEDTFSCAINLTGLIPWEFYFYLSIPSYFLGENLTKALRLSEGGAHQRSLWALNQIIV